MLTIEAEHIIPDCEGLGQAFLKMAHYQSILKCKTLSDLNNQLIGTWYESDEMEYEQEVAVLNAGMVDRWLKEKLAQEIQDMHECTTGQPSKFLDFVLYRYMIENVGLILEGKLAGEEPLAMLLDRCHPLGEFDKLEEVMWSKSPVDLYDVLHGTVICPFYENCKSNDPWTGASVERTRWMSYKEYLDAFYRYCESVGGLTAFIMCEILCFLADRYALNITFESLVKKRSWMRELYPTCGKLYPEGFEALAEATDYDQVKIVIEDFPEYFDLLLSADGQDDHKNLQRRLTEYEINMNVDSFRSKSQLGVLYSYIKLRERDCLNLVSIISGISEKKRTSPIDIYITTV